MALFVAVGSPACSSSEDGKKTCAEVKIDRFKELLVVEPSVVSDARSANATNGPWSFRHMMESLAGGEASDFVIKWATQFGTSETVNGFAVRPRPETTHRFICPWLRLRPENACDITCEQCGERKLDMARAPFRLIGIANRQDLKKKLGNAGEGRLLFTLTDGPGDDPRSQPLEMTVIFEFALPMDATRDSHYWATRWHELGSFPAFDEAYKSRLASVIEEFARQDSFAQARTNERVLDWDWQLREFRLVRGALVTSPTDDTPDPSLNGSAAVATFLKENSSSIMDNLHRVPASMLGGASNASVRWFFPKVTEDVRRAFARQTCNGCHQTEETPVDVNFHVSPFKKGVASLSPFLHDPADPTKGDLAVRSADMAEALCR